MVYTQRTPATLIMGIIMFAYGYAVKAGWLAGALKVVDKKGKHFDEMVAIATAAGIVGIVVGLWQLLVSPKEG